jgi:hypothetical protein
MRTAILLIQREFESATPTPPCDAFERVPDCGTSLRHDGVMQALEHPNEPDHYRLRSIA